ncbi:MAG: restriction endonuclease [Lysinibacillus sp.]|nr:restriction endonuclease [Lysinibacillus sp.]
MTKDNKLCEWIMLSIFSFTIVIASFNLISFELQVYDIQLYLLFFLTMILIYKPLRTKIFRLVFFSIVKSIFIIKNVIGHKENVEKELNEMKEMNGLEFDYFLRDLFEMHGYVATVTTEIENHRANLILWRGTKKYIVQTKSLTNHVTVRDVQWILANKKEYGADEVIVVTNHHFSSSAKKFAKLNNVTLIDHDKLIHMINNSERKFIFQTALSFIIHK